MVKLSHTPDLTDDISDMPAIVVSIRKRSRIDDRSLDLITARSSCRFEYISKFSEEGDGFRC